jgi:hypothetical protein
VVENTGEMKEIGGYFSLELSDRGGFLHDDGVLLNSCRNALYYILTVNDVKRIFIPYYVCDAVLEPIVRLGISYEFYSLNERLEIDDISNRGKDDFLLYPNYFGIKERYIQKLVKEYGEHIIIDNAQSYYSPVLSGVNCIYSPRKFFGVPDGGIAYLSRRKESPTYPEDKSYGRCSHLLRRLDEIASNGYEDFRKNEQKFKTMDVRLMSHLTRTILRSIDYDKVKGRRMENFMYLHKVLGPKNKLKIDMDGWICPMVYPFFTDDVDLKVQLIENKIYVATYWPNVLKWCAADKFEFKLAEKIVAIPIDQRYGIEDMDYIINIILK